MQASKLSGSVRRETDNAIYHLYETALQLFSNLVPESASYLLKTVSSSSSRRDRMMFLSCC